jgi:hypothetical protein
VQNIKNKLTDNIIAHVGYIVKDRETAVKRLSELYGITEWFWVDFRPFHTWTEGKEVDNYHLSCAISLPDEGTRLEVIQPISEGFHMNMLKEGVQTISHICYIVEDYDFYRNKYLGENTELIFEAEAEDDERGYRRCCYIYDCVLNTIIEFAEKPYFRK